MDCATAITLAAYEAIRKTIGDKQFDALFEKEDLVLGGASTAFSRFLIGDFEKPTQRIIGDLRRFKIPDPKNAAFGFENVIYVGNRENYYAHGLRENVIFPDLFTKETLNKTMNKLRKQPRIRWFTWEIPDYEQPGSMRIIIPQKKK